MSDTERIGNSVSLSSFSSLLNAPLNELRHQIKSRGIKGYVELLRAFREGDVDGSHSLSFTRLKKILWKLNLNISDKHLIEIRKQFDQGNLSFTNYEQFFRLIRGDLSEFRKRAVLQVFQNVCRNGNREVDAADMVNFYDATSHPDAVSGRRTADEIQNEFLETFDVTDEGNISLIDFENYYSNVGACIDDDDSFTNLLYSVWGIHNSNSNHSKNSGMNNNSVNIYKNSQPTQKDRKSSSSSIAFKDVPNMNAILQNNQNIYELPFGCQHAIRQICNEIFRKGISGYVELQRELRSYENQETGHINLSSFKHVIQQLGLGKGLKDLDLRLIYEHIQSQSTDTYRQLVTEKEIMNIFRPSLNKKRLGLVSSVFKALDTDRDSLVDPQDVVRSYDASAHPDVVSGSRSVQEVNQEFLESFDVGGEVEGRVTRAEFENYYTNLGACIADDGEFQAVVEGVWQACLSVLSRHKHPLPPPPPLPPAPALGSSRVSDIRESEMDMPPGNHAGLSRVAILSKMGLSSAPHGVLPGTLPFPRNNNNNSSSSNSNSNGGSNRQDEEMRKEMAKLRASRKPSRKTKPEPNVATQMIVQKLQKELRGLGVRGYVNLQREFQFVDTENRRHSTLGLQLSDLKRAFVNLSISPNFNNNELRQLFEYLYDHDLNGFDAEDLLSVSRLKRPPQSSQWRTQFIGYTYDFLLDSQPAPIDAQELARKFSPKSHPDVVSGSRSVQEVNQEFLESFDVGGEVEGRVTRAEFENYYTNLGACIDSDEEFFSLVKGVWRLDPDIGEETDETDGYEQEGEGGLLRSSASREGSTNSVTRVVARVQEELSRQGLRGVVNLQRSLRNIEYSYGCIPLLELKNVFPACGLAEILTEQQVEVLYEHVSGGQRVTESSVMSVLRPQLSADRRALIEAVFHSLDVRREGAVEVQELLQKFDASGHPAVTHGHLSADEVSQEFLESFDVGGEVEGRVTRAEFENYYTNLGACIADDSEFQAVVEGVWRAPASHAVPDTLAVAYAAGTEEGYSARDRDVGDGNRGRIKTLRSATSTEKPSTSTSQISFSQDDPQQQYKPSRRQVHKTAFASSVVLGDDGFSLKPKSTRMLKRDQIRSLDNHFIGAGVTHEEDPLFSGADERFEIYGGNKKVYDACQRLRQQLQGKGLRGYVNMGRKFRIADTSRSGNLSKLQFRRALKDSDLEISEEDLMLLLVFFDRKQTSFLNMYKFLYYMKGPEQASRRKLFIDHIFTELDTYRSGLIRPDDLLARYDASAHPDVVSGSRSVQEVNQEFLESFDVGGEVEGRVTRAEFENYYTNLGACIPDDAHFKALMTNVWSVKVGPRLSLEGKLSTQKQNTRPTWMEHS